MRKLNLPPVSILVFYSWEMNIQELQRPWRKRCKADLSFHPDGCVIQPVAVTVFGAWIHGVLREVALGLVEL